jgi:hypothetical protein
VKKTINLLGIIVVSTILCLTQASCIEFGFEDDPEQYSKNDSIPYLKVVNKHDLPISKVEIKSIDNYRYDYTFSELDIQKGKSETFPLVSNNASYSAEVIVYFGDKYSYKEIKLVQRRTTTVTLNVNGILE